MAYTRWYSRIENCSSSVTTSPNQSGIRAFVLNFGDEETQGISEAALLNDKGEMRNDKWYTLSGVKVDAVGAGVLGDLQSSVPARLRKGIYIRNGKKVVIK